jgi:formate dehydrogenase subunit gamma
MVAAYLAMALALVHIYLGTIGMKGAYQAMRTGYVDETWAKHHHERWYEEIKAGKSRQRFAQPGEQPPTAPQVAPSSRAARA